MNPANGVVLATYTATSTDALTLAIQEARAAQVQWAQVDLTARAEFINELADVMESQADRFAAIIADETGKSIKDAHEADLLSALATLRWVAQTGPRLLKPSWFTSINGLCLGMAHQKRYCPKGVVGLITPWNVPLAIPVGGLAPALMAGNAVVIKPSEHTPGTAMVFVEIIQRLLHQRGYPVELVQIVLGDGVVGKALTQSDIDHLGFTGSSAAGWSAYSVMASRGKTASLELGGNDPMVVLPGADMDLATSAAMWGRCLNAGQTCTAVKRMIVPVVQQADILERLQTKFRCLNVGPPSDPNCHYGPLISEQQLNHVETQVQQCIAEGGQVRLGGHRCRVDGFENGYYYAPTLITDLPPDAPMLSSEIFAPVLIVQTYTTIDEAVTLANHIPYGLGASVFGPTSQAFDIAKHLDAGVVTVNELPSPMYMLPNVPWTGRKASGPGVGHSHESILACCDVTTVTVSIRHWLPLLKKGPWFFGKAPDASLAPVLRKTFGNLSTWRKCSLDLLLGLWRNRSSQKL